jgi:hypothetical protein
LGKVSKTLGRASWTLDDFQKNLKLNNIGMDPSKDQNSNTIAHVEFGKKIVKRNIMARSQSPMNI